MSKYFFRKFYHYIFKMLLTLQESERRKKSILKDMTEVPPAHDYPLSFDEDNIAENRARREQDRFPTEHGI